MKNAMRDGSTCVLYVELWIFSRMSKREKDCGHGRIFRSKEGQLMNIGDLVFTTVLNMLLSDIFLDWRKTVQMVD